MAESVYKVIELIGTSTESWEKAALAAVETAIENAKGPAHRRGGRAGCADRGRGNHAFERR